MRENRTYGSEGRERHLLYPYQFLSRAFVVLLRKSIPQNHNLKTAAELNVMLF